MQNYKEVDDEDNEVQRSYGEDNKAGLGIEELIGDILNDNED